MILFEHAGDKKEALNAKISNPCSCCLTKPVAKGNRFLCTWCYSPQANGQMPAERNIPTEEDALELMVKVAIMERTPPTPVRHFSDDDHSQEQLRAILNGG